MKTHKIIYLLLILSGISLCSCSGVRNLQAPELDMPSSFMQRSFDSLSIADMTWWDYYGDEVLCGLITKALENNKDILMAASKVEEMRKLYGAAKTDLLPQISGNIYANNETNDYSGRHTSYDPELGVKATINWEADLWKRLSWSKKKGETQYLASLEDERAMQMIIVSEVAQAYFQLPALDSELDIVKRTLVTRSEGLHQAKLRFEGGLTSEIVYRQAEVEYTSTASLVPALEKSIQLTENAIMLLTGNFAGQHIPRSKAILSEVVDYNLRVGVPSSLLTRRPDLRAAEMRLRGAMADVGMAYADRFPRFTITITGGVENNKLADLIKSPFSYVAGALTGPIFDFGKRKKKYEASVSAYEQARLEYEKEVLTAFKEVNDATVSYQSARETARLKTELLQAAQKYEELSRIQYLGGTSLYIDVLDAQRRYFDAQIALSNAVRDEYLSLVRLYKSLGGGWQRNQDKGGSSPVDASTEL